MKELSIEQKANRYDKALEKSKRLYEQGTITESLAYIFPELTESEDERIRKEIIAFLTYYHTGQGNSVKYDDGWIAWLEKQGESYTKRDVDDAYVEGMALAKNELEKQGNSPIKWNKNTEGNKPQVNHSVLMKTTHGIAEGEWQGEYWHQYRWAGIVRDSDVLSWMELSDLEKQGEQKPADVRTIGYWHVEDVEQKPANKVNPKFRNRQWIVWQDKCYKVINNGCCYELVDQDGLSTSLEYGTIDENARLWDITKDAKDGDVLFMNNGAANCIFIYKSSNNGIINKYASYNKFGFEGEHYLVLNDGYVIPATKEQRDQLKKAMTDAGYIFDFEKKDLKKIEQKPAWSEEDEEIHRKCICAMRASACGFPEEEKFVEQVDNWLKCLKERYVWKPSDEQMETLEYYMHTLVCNSCKETLFSLYQDLKKLKG